jgi:predicted ATPase
MASLLRLKNVRCFRDAKIPLDPRTTVIVGGNASGKTTLMESLASLSHGDDEGLTDFPLRHGTKHGEIALYESDARSAVAKWDSQASSRTRLRSDSYIFLYGRYRRVPSPDAEPRNLSDAECLDQLAYHAGRSRTTTITRSDNRLVQDLPDYLRGLNLGREGDPRLETLWAKLNQTLPAMDPSLSAIRMDQGQFQLMPRLVRNGIAVEFSQLSDGYQAILVIVLDLMLRYGYLFLEGDPLSGRAIVGIDEIDLHLHPRWQRTVLPQLTELFPNTQFIVTTHSPIVVQSAIDQGHSVLRLSEQDGAADAQPLSQRLMKSLRGAEVGSLLFEARLFDVDSRFSVEYDDVENRAGELQSKVSTGEATDADYEALKQCLHKWEDLVAKEDRRRADGSVMAHLVRMQTDFVKALTDELKKARE